MRNRIITQIRSSTVVPELGVVEQECVQDHRRELLDKGYGARKKASSCCPVCFGDSIIRRQGLPNGAIDMLIHEAGRQKIRISTPKKCRSRTAISVSSARSNGSGPCGGVYLQPCHNPSSRIGRSGKPQSLTLEGLPPCISLISIDH